jgi:hypothetical protein
MSYIPATYASSARNGQTASVIQIREREAELRFYNQLEREARTELLKSLSLRDWATGNSFRVPAPPDLHGATGASARGSCVPPSAPCFTVIHEANEQFRPPNAATKPESSQAIIVPTRTVRPPEALAETKKVHWAPTAKVTGTVPPSILRPCIEGPIWTVPFVVQLTICGRTYKIDFDAVKVDTARVGSFENRLVNAVHKGHRETLVAFLKYQYTLRFSRLLRMSTTIIPATGSELREAAFTAFVNAVPKDAMVSLI